MKKETLYILLLVIIAATSYYGYSFFTKQKDFQQKQQCHDEAVKYVDNKQMTFNNQIKLSNDKTSYGLIYDSYNKELNTCLAYYEYTNVPDNVKYHNLGITYWEAVDDVLTGRQLDWWATDYKVNSYDVENSTGQRRGKGITNRKDFDDELALLFGNDYKNYLATPTPTQPETPSPTELPGQSSFFNTQTATPIPAQSYRQIFINSCSFGSIYCTCLYNALHQDYTDNEISNDLKASGTSYQSDPMFVNAFSECNSRFDSK